MDDLISRQAAIDAVERNACNTQRIYDAIKDIQPAQPEIIRCKDCKHSEYDKLCGVMRCIYNGKAEIVHGEHYCGYADMRGNE